MMFYSKWVYTEEVEDKEDLFYNERLISNIYSFIKFNNNKWEDVLEENVLYIDYEDLINNTKSVLKRVLDYMGIDHFNIDFNSVINNCFTKKNYIKNRSEISEKL